MKKRFNDTSHASASSSVTTLEEDNIDRFLSVNIFLFIVFYVDQQMTCMIRLFQNTFLPGRLPHTEQLLPLELAPLH